MQTIALSMIARNASADIERCLKSAAPAVNQIIVADTGSADNTAELARACGAEVISIRWENDFARARNLALTPVHADWVLVLDADEMLDAEAKSLLPDLVNAPAVHGYQVKIRNYVPRLEYRLWDRVAKPNDSTLQEARQFPAYLEHENVRLFRRDPAIFFVGRVHETVGKAIESSGLKLGRANFLIHHFGLIAAQEETQRKNIFYRDLGRQKVADMPSDAQAHLELGIAELDHFNSVAEALACFERACELKPGMRIAWFFAGVALCRLGSYSRALLCLKKAESLGENTAATAELTGNCYYNLGRFDSACSLFKLALRRSPANNDLKSKLGLAEVRAGNYVSGFHKMQNAIATEPSNPVLYDRSIQAAVWSGHLEDASAIAEKKLGQSCAKPQDFVRAASIRAQCKQWREATEIVHLGLVRFWESQSLLNVLSELERSNPSFDLTLRASPSVHNSKQG